MKISRNEFRWREWVLGEGDYAGMGPRSRPRPNVGYGGPGQRPVPRAWWQRLEEFLVRRNDRTEAPGPHRDKPSHAKVRDPLQLTRHFNVREFACHDGRQVPKIAVPALKRLCLEILEPMRAEFGPATVMSGYRPRDYNARIGGAEFSQHIYELTPDSVAADVIFARGNPAAWARKTNALGAGGVGTYGTFVHVDNRPGKARWFG